MRVSQVPARVFRLNRLCFKQKNARDNLEAVVDPVIHLFEKKILLPQQLVLLALQGASPGDIFDRQQQARAAVAVVDASILGRLRLEARCTWQLSGMRQSPCILAKLWPYGDILVESHFEMLNPR